MSLVLAFYSRIVPEYSFLDARGLGAYEGKALAAVNEVSIWNHHSFYITRLSFHNSLAIPSKVEEPVLTHKS